jgi:TrpR-related protein YerC/YecD
LYRAKDSHSAAILLGSYKIVRKVYKVFWDFTGVFIIMNKKLETAEMDELLRAILSLETVEEAYEFFEDLCTVNEMVAMKQRFEVAKMLREERTYQDIADETGASSATISRVNRALNYGNDGYDMVLNRISN